MTQKMNKHKPMTNDQKITYLQEIWEESVDLTEASRREAREMAEYKRGNQLPDDVISILNGRGQPLRWENIIEEVDRAIAGMKSMTKTEIDLVNRHEDDAARVRVMESIHRATLDSTEWWSHKKRSDEDLRIAGLSCIESSLVLLDEFDKKGKQLKEVRREYFPVLECFLDMYSRKPDYSDARYFHHSRLYYKPDLVRKFKKEAEKLQENAHGMTRVNRTWYKDGDEIRIATWFDGVLLEDVPQPYTRTRGRFSVSVRRSNYSHVKEYVGMYRNLKPFQDDINNMMLRIKNMLSSIKIILEATSVPDVDTFKDEFSEDNSVTVVNDGALSQKRIEVINLTSNIAQIMTLVQDARRKGLQIIGINPELLGTSTTRQSGVALEIKQNAGLIGLQEFMTTSFELDKDVFENDTAIIEEHFRAEQVFAITGRQGDREHFSVNEYERDGTGRLIFVDGVPKQKSILSVGRYDFIMNQVPFNNGSTDAKMKSWAEMMKIVRPDRAEALIPSMLRDVGSPQAEETREILAKLDERDAKTGNNEAQELQMKEMMLRLSTMEAKIAETASKANLNNAKAGEIAGNDTDVATKPDV